MDQTQPASPRGGHLWARSSDGSWLVTTAVPSDRCSWLAGRYGTPHGYQILDGHKQDRQLGRRRRRLRRGKQGEEAARTAGDPHAELVLIDSGLDDRGARHAWLEGTTADVGPMSGQKALSRLRAEHVRAELIALGASGGQISTSGVGSDFPQFTPDRNASGILLAGPAALNRSVRITLN